jgi:MtN3 and saliva related transmembrane protein
MSAELVGWASAAVLLATIVQQVYKQWRSGSTAGVSKWLFVGQALASLGFSVYSAMTGNVVFLVVNVALLASGVAGELIYLRNRRRKAA